MMSRVIQQETVVFLLSVLHGIGLTFGYDLLRSLRRVFRHGVFAVSAEDFLFWLTAGFLTFCLAFFKTDGVIRGYVAAGIAIGAILYHYTVSSLVVRAVSGLLKGIKHIFCLVWRILSKPARKIWLFWKKSIEFTRKKGYNVTKIRIRRGNSHGRKKKAAQQE